MRNKSYASTNKFQLGTSQEILQDKKHEFYAIARKTAKHISTIPQSINISHQTNSENLSESIFWMQRTWEKPSLSRITSEANSRQIHNDDAMNIPRQDYIKFGNLNQYCCFTNLRKAQLVENHQRGQVPPHSRQILKPVRVDGIVQPAHRSHLTMVMLVNVTDRKPKKNI